MKIPVLNKDIKVYDLINDKLKKYLWGLRFVNLENTWLKVCENELSQIRIALIDSGVDSKHEDLENVIEPGYNFVNNSLNTDDDFSHGTRIAGVIGAKKNNHIGIAGVASGVNIIPLKVIDENGKASIKNVIKALEYAIKNEVDIINLSIGYQWDMLNLYKNGSVSLLEEEYELIKYALDKSITIIGSVGNGFGRPMQYPACYNGVISVASCGLYLDPLELYLPEKNNSYDQETIFAPGEYILTSDVGNSYVYDSGSSLASAFVTGAVALLKAKNSNLTPKDIYLILNKSCSLINIDNKKIKFLNIDNSFKMIAHYDK